MYFSLRSDNLVIRARHKDGEDIFELIPQEKLQRDLPAILIKGHAHWLNLSTHIIEIRPLKTLWDQSLNNWRINHASRPYHMTKGHESLVDMQSPTWRMVSRRLKCLDIPDNLIITASPADGAQSPPPLRLSVTLPRYGLSFFVNNGGDLESRDFKDMVCDENQCIGTLFGLVNRLVLRPKAQIEEDLIPRCILIPNGEPRLERHDHQPRVVIKPRRSLFPVRSRAVEGSRQHDKTLCHIYTVDGTLGCLTGISSLHSRLYLAELHFLTNVCRPDQLTGRTGVEEAISLAWLAGDRFFPDSIPMNGGVGSSQIQIAIKRFRNGPVGFDAELERRRTAVQKEAYLYPSEIVARLPKEDQVDIRPSEPSLVDDLVYTAASTVDRWSLNAPVMNDLSSWAEAWGDTIVGDNPSSQLEGLQSNFIVPPLRMKIYNLLGRGGATRRFQLLFSLPVMLYSSGNRQGTLLSTLVAFAKQPHVHLENPPRYAGYNLWDGYHPDSRRVESCITASRSHLEVEIDRFIASHSYLEVEVDTAVKQLLGSWPSGIAPTASLDPDRFDVVTLNASLQPLFSSWYRNFKLKKYLSCVCQCGEPMSLPPNSCKLEPPPDWQTTLDQLLRERPAPELPPCHRLPHRKAGFNGVSSSNIARLGQLFSSLPTDGKVPEFQTQYVTRLQASAQHVRAGETRAGSIRSGSAARPGTGTLREHYVQCKARYTKSLHSVKEALGPITQIEQILDRCGQWPRATPYTLFRCLASTSPIKPSGKWRKCLISLTLLALELQRARRLLQFASDNLEEELFRELENEGGDGWVAAEHPDWLLIQVRFP